MKKNSNKGFTLVELIVVLVILAILAAILVPALLGYIDKAREKQTTTNAEAAYVAAQAMATEAYGKGYTTPVGYVTKQKIADLTDIPTKDMQAIAVTYNGATNSTTTSVGSDGSTELSHADFIISVFSYYDGNYTAVWKQSEGGNWTVTAGKNLEGTEID